MINGRGSFLLFPFTLAFLLLLLQLIIGIVRTTDGGILGFLAFRLVLLGCVIRFLPALVAVHVEVWCL